MYADGDIITCLKRISSDVIGSDEFSSIIHVYLILDCTQLIGYQCNAVTLANR